MITEDEIKNEIVRISRVLYDRQLITALGGNISGRIPGQMNFGLLQVRYLKAL